MLEDFEDDENEGNAKILLESFKKREMPEIKIFPKIKDEKVDKKDKPQSEKPKLDKHGRPITWVSIGGLNFLKARAKPKETPSQAEQQEKRVERPKTGHSQP
jgi:hypothetical protein